MTSYLNGAASALAVAMTLVVAVPQVHGQTKPTPRSRPVSPSILQAVPSGDSRGWAKFIWVGGHLQMDAPRHKRGSQTIQKDDCRESFTVTARDGIPSAHYAYHSPDWQWMLSFEKAKSLRIESWDPATNRRVVAIQRPGQEIVVTDELGDVTHRITAATWIHLFHQERALVNRHFAPLVDALVPSQSLQTLSIATENAGPVAMQSLSATPDQIAGWIHDLKSRRRKCRRAAEKKMLACGSPILGTLHAFDRDRLDAHQNAVIDLVVQRLSPVAADQATTLACRFVYDKSYWTALLNDSERTTAMTSGLATHLRSLGIEHASTTHHLVSRANHSSGDHSKR